MILALARLQTSCSPCASRRLCEDFGLHRVLGAPLPHKRHAGPKAIPFRRGDAGEGPPAPPPPAQQPHSGFQQGVCEPHKGNGKIVSHPEARLLPRLLAHNRTFVLCSRRTRKTGVGWGAGGKHFRTLSNALRGGACPPEAGPTSGAGTQARLGVSS